MVNCQRMHLFDVVNQYRAIFSDDTSGSEENYDGGLLFSWAMHQITSHLKTLKVMLLKITEGGSLSNILDQCMVGTYSYIFVLLCGFSIFFIFDGSRTKMYAACVPILNDLHFFGLFFLNFLFTLKVIYGCTFHAYMLVQELTFYFRNFSLSMSTTVSVCTCFRK